MKENTLIKDFKEFNSNPFSENEKELSIVNMMLELSKSGQMLLTFMLKKKAFDQDKFLVDMDEFLIFSGYKTKTSCFKALAELCSKRIIARTKYSFFYWINKRIFSKEVCNVIEREKL